MTKTMSLSKQRKILNYITQLKNKTGRFYRLQMTYNNNIHSEISNVLSFPYDFSVLSYFLNDPYNILHIEGDIHNYFHRSNVIKSLKTDKALFVEDSYIRFRINNEIYTYHLLIEEPKIIENDPFYVNSNFPNPVFPITKSITY